MTEILSGLTTLIIILFVAAFIAQPYFTNRQSGGGIDRRQAAGILKRQSQLLADRNDLYAAIHELDFDYQTNKISDDDYAGQRYLLVAQGVDILQELDSLPVVDPLAMVTQSAITRDSDPVETMIQAARSGQPVQAVSAAPAADSSEQAGFCPKCGQRVHQDDKFCGSCGQRL